MSYPPLKNSQFAFDISLASQSNPNIFQANPTLAAGDVTVSKDGGSFVNIASLPTQIGSSGCLSVALSASEMNADRVVVRFHDQAGDEWQDLLVTIETETVQLNDLATAAALQTVDDNVDAILVDTDTTIPGLIAALNDLSAAQVNAEVVDVLRTDPIPDSYAAVGAQPSIAQALLEILQWLTEKSVSGTTMTVYKPDGVTGAMTFEINHAVSPTKIERTA